MSKRQYGDYYLGLDIGTESVGWAVTDEAYRVPKFGQKSMWGVRLFSEAQRASDRRLYRVARRRLERRAQRLDLLRELFAEEINHIDPGFFPRMQEGALHMEDKSPAQKNNLFDDLGMKDKDYHKKYPTIYHLRHALMTATGSFDARLVYLALHHILKYRGHFLFGGTLDQVPSLESILAEMAQESNDYFGFALDASHADDLAAVLTDKNLRMTAKQKRLNDLFGVSDARAKAVIKAMTGGKVKLSAMFDLSLDEEKERISIEFGTEAYETLVPELEELLGIDFYYLDKLKAIYDWATLESIVPGGMSLSEARVLQYEEHRRDLKVLKRLIKSYAPDKYKEVFSDPAGKNNYAVYIGMTMKNGKKLPVDKKCSQVDFNKYLTSVLKDVKAEDKDLAYVREKLETATFLPKAVSKANGVLPYQLHYNELRTILSKAENYLPFLKVKGLEGLTVSDKILMLLTFRIPYYVGPLNNRDPKAQNTWVERFSQEKIYPWNFDKVVDVEQSASRFIMRMLSDCTYLLQEKVLPRQSILYSRYTVLNELNNLKLMGEPISVSLKQDIYNDLFMTRARVTRKGLITYLNSKGLAVEAEDVTGIDGDFKANLKPLLDMKALLGPRYNEEMAEEIIRLSAIFGDDRQMLERRIQSAYGDVLPGDVIRRAASKRFTDWGRFSRLFLVGIKAPNPETGEYNSIIDMLWETNNNLMELLGKAYGFSDEIAEYNEQFHEETGFGYHLVENLYVAPSVRRSIWQSLKLVEEIRKITGHDPKKLFIEVARGEEKKEVKESRKKRLSDLYKACGEQAAELAAELETKADADLRRDRLYLYFTQMGRCMYTGKEINIKDIFSPELYDVDHIYPQSLVKDDSLNNRVLVDRKANAEKGDTYPLKPEIRKANQSYWHMLLEKGFISKRKYERLVRSTPLEADELLDFINRQLVETRQSTKAVAQIMEALLPDTKVVYVKARLASDFRNKYDLLKCREVNDLHHATDAYLNVVVGNAYHTKFTSDPRNFFSQPDHRYNLRTFFEYDIKRGNSVGWLAGEAGSIKTVKHVIRKNNALVTRMPFSQQGALFDTQLVRKNLWQLPQGSAHPGFADPSKYGGYNKVTGAYFMLVEHEEKKGRRSRSLIDMPLHLTDSLDEGQVKDMLKKDKGLIDPVILIPKIRMNSLFDVDGFRMNITGRTGVRIIYAPAQQLKIGAMWESYLRDVLKFAGRCAEYRRLNLMQNLTVRSTDGITRKKNVELYEIFLAKLRDSSYGVWLGQQAINLESAKERFIALSEGDQCEMLKEILNFFTCNRAMANLQLLNLGSSLGIIRTNRTLSGYKKALLIHQSVTGLFEQVVDLLK